MRKITILGSTGSIGTQTLDIVGKHRDDFEVFALVAGSNVDLMARQVVEFVPKLVVMKDEETADALKVKIANLYESSNSKKLSEENSENLHYKLDYSSIDDVRVIYGMDGYIEAVTADEVDLVVAAMVGMIGLRPVMRAIEAGKDIALANKETLVCAGHIIMPLAAKHGVQILPVDSEHSAIFQCLNSLRSGYSLAEKYIDYSFENKDKVLKDRENQGENNVDSSKELETIYLTASGGPFRNSTLDELESVTVEQALAHPNWSMGNKITIDSATMINKGLEIIEAKWLFGVELEQIHVLVQPKSIIHSMVGFSDGAVLAQLGTPDMRVPIQYALYYPHRVYLDDERLDFETLAQITFEKPNTDVLRGIPIAMESARIGGSMPTVMNAANEYAVAKFLNKEIEFLDIYKMIEYAMEKHNVIDDPSLDDILESERDTYKLLDKYMTM